MFSALTERYSLTNFEVGGLQGGTGEQPWEHHVDGNGKAAADIAFSYLDVLDLCGISGITFSTTWTGEAEDRETLLIDLLFWSSCSRCSPQVSTRTSCSSMLLMGMSEFSTFSSPVSGWVIMQFVASKWPRTRNLGSVLLWTQTAKFLLWENHLMSPEPNYCLHFSPLGHFAWCLEWCWSWLVWG